MESWTRHDRVPEDASTYCADCPLGVQASSKYCLAKAPKLVEIMNAVPEEFKSILIPQYATARPTFSCVFWRCITCTSHMLAPPSPASSCLRGACTIIRTSQQVVLAPDRASSVEVRSSFPCCVEVCDGLMTSPCLLQAAGKACADGVGHSSRGCDVQAAQVPPHCHHRQHLRLLPRRPRLRL